MEAINTHLHNAINIIKWAKAIINPANPEVAKFCADNPEPRAKDIERYGYEHVNGELFVDRAHISDVDQGNLGNCYFMAALGSIVVNNPQVIKNMIQDHGNGNYTVTFYDENSNGELVPFPVYVNGTEFLMEDKVTSPFRKDNMPSYAGFGADNEKGKLETWPMILEKAYVVYQGDRNMDGVVNYEDIEGGNPGKVMEQMTGIRSEYFDPADITFESLEESLSNGGAVSVGTFTDEQLKDKEKLVSDLEDGKIWEKNVSDPVASVEHKKDALSAYEKGGIIEKQLSLSATDNTGENIDKELATNHAYYVTGVDEDSEGQQWVELRNPWDGDRGQINLTLDQFKESFRMGAVNPVAAAP